MINHFDLKCPRMYRVKSNFASDKEGAPHCWVVVWWCATINVHPAGADSLHLCHILLLLKYNTYTLLYLDSLHLCLLHPLPEYYALNTHTLLHMFVPTLKSPSSTSIDRTSAYSLYITNGRTLSSSPSTNGRPRYAFSWRPHPWPGGLLREGYQAGFIRKCWQKAQHFFFPNLFI